MSQFFPLSDSDSDYEIVPYTKPIKRSRQAPQSAVLIGPNLAIAVRGPRFQPFNKVLLCLVDGDTRSLETIERAIVSAALCIRYAMIYLQIPLDDENMPQKFPEALFEISEDILFCHALRRNEVDRWLQYKSEALICEQLDLDLDINEAKAYAVEYLVEAYSILYLVKDLLAAEEVQELGMQLSTSFTEKTAKRIGAFSDFQFLGLGADAFHVAVKHTRS